METSHYIIIGGAALFTVLDCAITQYCDFSMARHLYNDGEIDQKPTIFNARKIHKNYIKGSLGNYQL